MAKFKCTNPECEKYDVLVEISINEDGTWNSDPESGKICNVCGSTRIINSQDKKSSIGINELALNTKRMYEPNVKKYT